MYSTSKKVKYPTQKKRVYATGEGSLLTLHLLFFWHLLFFLQFTQKSSIIKLVVTNALFGIDCRWHRQRYLRAGWV